MDAARRAGHGAEHVDRGRDLHLQHFGIVLARVAALGGGPRAARDIATPAGYNATARAEGIVVADREFEHDVVDFSAPVRDESGAVVAALSLAVPRFRPADRSAEIAASVKAAAAALEVRAAADRAAWRADRPDP
ncbi:hypothetical protein OG948_38910 (plasmid) [Embleya sp. NBC_00888]|uniref:IclR family transcriptional regulator domain-containing protein n=1 Tax=Embleya sp. NBC_00888 TaxID=2975960 RepID=UPI002F90727A|nr:hypothetical protein OG948_38910 [Embleya sp. NBC_00888]